MPFQNYFLFEKFGGNEFFLNAASAKQSWSSTNHIGRFGGLDVILQRSLDHKERYVGSLFRVDEPVRVPRGAHLYIKGWLPSI